MTFFKFQNTYSMTDYKGAELQLVVWNGSSIMTVFDVLDNSGLAHSCHFIGYSPNQQSTNSRYLFIYKRKFQNCLPIYCFHNLLVLSEYVKIYRGLHLRNIYLYIWATTTGRFWHVKQLHLAITYLVNSTYNRKFLFH